MDRKWGLVVGTVVLLVLVLAGMGYGVYRLVMKLTPSVLAVWALVATGGLPLAAWAGWRLGQLEARGQLEGLKMGLTTAVQAGRDVADVKVTAVRAMRQTETVRPVALPQVEILSRKELDARGGDVVEL